MLTFLLLLPLYLLSCCGQSYETDYLYFPSNPQGPLGQSVGFPCGINACGYSSNNVPTTLYNKNFNKENKLEVGLGIDDSLTNNAITSTSFVQLKTVDNKGWSSFPQLAISFQHLSDSTDGDPNFTVWVFGSNQEGACYPPSSKSDVIFLGDNTGSSNPTDFIILKSNYVNFPYLCANAEFNSIYPNQLVLLSQIRFAVTVSTSKPTLKPSFKPSFRPTNSPTCPENGYEFLIQGLGINNHNNEANFYPQVTLYGYNGGTPANLYSKDETEKSQYDFGMGLENASSQEISGSYAIYIGGLQSLENVALSMCALASQGDNYAWAWHGSHCLPDDKDCRNYNDVLIYNGSGSSSGMKGWYWPVSNSYDGYSWKDFKFVKVNATKGSVLLAAISYTEC